MSSTLRIRRAIIVIVGTTWYDAIDAGVIASCYVQRSEFLYSARNGREYDEIAEMSTGLCPDVSVPKNAGRWISAVQHRMTRAGEHRGASAVDLVIAGPFGGLTRCAGRPGASAAAAAAG